MRHEPNESLHETIPESFIRLEDPRFIIDMNYATADNFLGRPVAGYQSPQAYLTKAAAQALTAVQDTLDKNHPGFRLRIFDAYRPTQAVDDFMRWSNEEINIHLQQRYFPGLQKNQLFELGYIAGVNSAHSRGSTVDLTICKPFAENNKHYIDLDMGTIIDFFGEKAHTDFPFLTEQCKRNRHLLKSLMAQQGFKNYEKEWWHYTLQNETFPETYFNFVIK